MVALKTAAPKAAPKSVPKAAAKPAPKKLAASPKVDTLRFFTKIYAEL
jgi:hypothetical protein